MAALYTIVFGTCEEADRAGERARRAHLRVRGARDETRYTASDPDLMLWVHATLVDTGLELYERYVRPVEPDLAEEFYAQMRVVAGIFGVPDDVHPATLADFRAYLREMVETGAVRVGPDARAVARTVLAPPAPLPLRPALHVLVTQTAGLLPDTLRDQYGLRAPLPGAVGSTRRLVPLLPTRIRQMERLPLRVLTALAGT